MRSLLNIWVQFWIICWTWEDFVQSFRCELRLRSFYSFLCANKGCWRRIPSSCICPIDINFIIFRVHVVVNGIFTSLPWLLANTELRSLYYDKSLLINILAYFTNLCCILQFLLRFCLRESKKQVHCLPFPQL